jgi:2-(1,2-epoxy-1,2-dihydrophenyl)acetyl-CoA isomerase
MNPIITEVKNSVFFITLNRPDVLNAFNSEMLFALQDAFKQAEKEDIRCVVLTGNGKGFCSGQDLKDFESEKKTFKEALEEKYNPLIKQIMNLPKPVICGINGVAAGAGCSMALACDFRIAAEGASLIEIFINIALIPDSASTFTLPRMAGLTKAFQMCATAEKLSATQAKNLGLINVLVYDQSVLKIALERYSSKFSAMPTKALGKLKELLNRSFYSDLDSMLDAEANAQDLLGNSHDYKEGVTAFLEKRKPVYRGN